MDIMESQYVHIAIEQGCIYGVEYKKVYSVHLIVIKM